MNSIFANNVATAPQTVQSAQTMPATALNTPENAAAMQPEQPVVAHENPKRKKTAGEVIFDRTVYTGIGFGVNEASSLWITSQFLYGKPTMGKWFSKEGFEEISKILAKKFNVKPKLDKATGKMISGEAKAGNMMLMVTLLSGGTLLILPMRWLENSKAYWVKKANHWVDKMKGNQMSAEDVAARDAEVEQAIACSPKQSWGTMLLGRVVACSASVATGTWLVGPKNNEKLMDKSEKIFTGSLKPESERTVSRGIARLGLVETYSCAISSIVLEVASKFFAKKKQTPRNPEICNRKEAIEQDELPTTNGTQSNAAPVDVRKFKPTESYVKKVQNEQEQVVQASL